MVGVNANYVLKIKRLIIYIITVLILSILSLTLNLI